MGAGKTTLGRQLARRLDKRFVDADHELEGRLGVTIPTIFEIEGEAGFRDREEAIIDELTQMSGVVLATGGGAVLRPENRELLHTRTVCVFLDASHDLLWKRLRRDRRRPLLQVADPEARLRELSAERDPLYRETAHIIVQADGLSFGRLVDEVVRRISGENGR